MGWVRVNAHGLALTRRSRRPETAKNRDATAWYHGHNKRDDECRSDRGPVFGAGCWSTGSLKRRRLCLAWGKAERPGGAANEDCGVFRGDGSDGSGLYDEEEIGGLHGDCGVHIC